MRAVRKVSVRFECLENWLRGLDVTWQPVRGDLSVHPLTVNLLFGESVGSETPLTIACVLCDHCIHKSPPFQQRF